MVTLRRSIYDQIVAHAQGHPEAEVCGMLGGRYGRVEEVYRARNIAENPRTRFKIDPHDIAAISDQVEDLGMELIGFYHSHTHTQAYPSPTDVADWPAPWYPDALCFICSLLDEEWPVLRAFRIGEGGEIGEEPIVIEEGDPLPEAEGV